MRSTDIRVVDCKFETESFAYRSPIKFGGVALDKATLPWKLPRAKDQPAGVPCPWEMSGLFPPKA
jgi:hypothetical protein